MAQKAEQGLKAAKLDDTINETRCCTSGLRRELGLFRIGSPFPFVALQHGPSPLHALERAKEGGHVFLPRSQSLWLHIWEEKLPGSSQVKQRNQDSPCSLAQLM